MSMCVHFAEELWTIKTVIIHTFLLPGNCSLLISSLDLLESSTSPTTAIFHRLCMVTSPFYAALLPLL